MPIAKTPQRIYPPQYPLRTLVWLTVLAPPLLALASWWLIPVWRHFDGHTWLGPLVVLVLIGISIFYYPVSLSPRIRLPRWQVILLWCAEFAALWHWLAFISALFGWLFVWGDRHAPPMEMIYPVTALFAASISSLTSMRLTRDGATIGYLVVVVSLTAILIAFAMPYWLARLLR